MKNVYLFNQSHEAVFLSTLTKKKISFISTDKKFATNYANNEINHKSDKNV